MEIKICGITNIPDALIAAEYGVDALGFIFYLKSPRVVVPRKAKEIIHELPGEICKVGVFVNHEITQVKEIVQCCGLDLIQLHGDERPEYCAQFPASSLIKAVYCKTEEALREIRNFPVGAILMDGCGPEQYGGTGKISDWELAIKVKKFHPLILAGGLNKNNIRQAIEKVRPQAVDINSGVEISPGRKDHRKLKEIVGIVREIDAPSSAPFPSRGEGAAVQSRHNGAKESTRTMAPDGADEKKIVRIFHRTMR